MKIKQDFITNSSSTSFTFIFKGDKFDLYEALLKRKEKFDIIHNDYQGISYKINVWDVIRAIDSVVRTTPEDLWLLPATRKIDVVLKEHKDNKSYLKEHMTKEEQYTGSWYVDSISIVQHRIDLLNKAKSKGLTEVFVLGFGDNSGEISGKGVGAAMDDEGRKINIDDDDLIIFTDQER